MKRGGGIFAILILCLLPHLAQAGIASGIQSLQSVLDKIYADMLPKCSSLIGVARGIAGFAALWYIATRVWGHIARAEQVDFYPLFRPFALGLAILLFPGVIGIMNGVLKPTVTGTAKLVDDSNKSIEVLLKQKQAELAKHPKWKALVGPDGQGNREEWMKYYHKDEIGNEGFFGSIGNDISFAIDKAMFNFKNSIKQAIATILEIIYQAAALCINTLRTFNLILLAILGPLVFAIATFDGFQHLLQTYIARYINIFLWLPICNILGALLGNIQENMIKLDISQIMENGDTVFSSYDLGYIVFMIIGIYSFFCVPSIADMVVFVGGGSALQQKITNLYTSTTNTVKSVGGGVARDTMNMGQSLMQSGMSVAGSNNYVPDNSSNYQRGKLSG